MPVETSETWLIIWRRALGFPPPAWISRAMRAILFGVPPSDPLTLAAGVLVVLLATLVGSLAPAVNAVRVSPLIAMRAD